MRPNALPIPAIGLTTIRRSRYCGLLIVLGVSISTAPLASSPAGGAYVLRKEVIAGGGARSSGGSYVLVGTVGQASTATSSGPATVLQHGFHGASVVQPDPLFSNGFE